MLIEGDSRDFHPRRILSVCLVYGSYPRRIFPICLVYCVLIVLPVASLRTQELKHLYTAITRARVRVIIYDQDIRKRAPMFYYLEKRQLVQTLASFAGETFMPMAVHSGVDEWRAQGKNLRDNGLYQLAAKCFAQSGDKDLETEAQALHLSCRRANEVSGKERQKCFFEAAEKFLSIAKAVEAANCFYEAEYYELAGRCFVAAAMRLKQEKDKQAQDTLLRNAMKSFRRANKTDQALDLLVKLGRMKTALRQLKQDHKYDKAVALLEQHPTFKPPDELSMSTFVKLSAAQQASLRNSAKDEASRAQATTRFLEAVSKVGTHLLVP
jgi:tetratricopeptide (TPR) repeat protein